MKKSVSVLLIIVAGVMSIAPSHGAQMTPQIQRLLEQKEEKIKKLEECDGKRRGWMIAGISTIGVTAVGVGVNIAQASKRNRLDDEIDTARHDLEKKQEDLSRIQNQISEKERENAKRECGQQEGMVWQNGQCVPVEKEQKSGNEKSESDLPLVKEKNETPHTLELPVGGVIWTACSKHLEEIGANTKSGVWITDSSGQYYCKHSENDVGYTIQCSCGSVETSGATGGDEKPKDKSGGGEKTKDKKEWKEGFVRIGGQGQCVKVDYVVGHGYADSVCKCEDGSANCTLVRDDKGLSVCQYGKGEGEKCSCVVKKSGNTPGYALPSYNPYGESGECKGEYGDRVTKGCTCKSAKGLVSRFNGPKGDNFCECPNGKTWNAGEDKCVDIKKTEKKEEETPKYQLPSYSFDYALPVTSGNCAGITQCNNVKTFIPKTEEELKCLKQNCDNIGGKWRQEHKLTYVCGC